MGGGGSGGEKILFLISGKVGVGKDTVANFISEMFADREVSVFRQPIADPLKGVVVELVNLFTGGGCHAPMTMDELNILKDDEYARIGGSDYNMRGLLFHVSNIVKRRVPHVWVHVFIEAWAASGAQVGIVPDIRFDELEGFGALLPTNGLSGLAVYHVEVQGPARDRAYWDVDIVNTMPATSSTLVFTNEYATLAECRAGVRAFVGKIV